jgi:hypothetical protein
MKIRYTYFREHLLFCVLAPLVIVIGVISYYRFMVSQDYVVAYEGVCDPAQEKCFINCEDNACTKMDYYSNMLKYAPDLYAECGKDITGCDAANVCLPSDRKCSITYCDPKIDGDDTCSTSADKSDTSNDNQVDSGEQKSLQNNDTSNP